MYSGSSFCTSRSLSGIAVCLSIAEWRYTLAVFKYPNEMAVVTKTELLRDPADAHRSSGQKIAGFQDSLSPDVLLGCLTVAFFKTFDKIWQADAAHIGEPAVGNVFFQMGLNIAFCHFPGDGSVFCSPRIGTFR